MTQQEMWEPVGDLVILAHLPDDRLVKIDVTPWANDRVLGKAIRDAIIAAHNDVPALRALLLEAQAYLPPSFNSESLWQRIEQSHNLEWEKSQNEHSS